MESRIVELETRIAYQEDMIQSLNDVVAKQESKIDSLQLAIEQLRQQMLQMGSGPVADPSQETPPPHY